MDGWIGAAIPSSSSPSLPKPLTHPGVSSPTYRGMGMSVHLGLLVFPLFIVIVMDNIPNGELTYSIANDLVCTFCVHVYNVYFLLQCHPKNSLYNMCICYYTHFICL